MFNSQKAFTLIELLVTVTVVSVLIVVGIPNFKDQISNSRGVALTEDLSTRINQARYEAIKRAKRVSLCASSNSTTATPTCTGNWVDGYIMFVDTATSDGATAPVIGTVLKAYSKHDPKAVIDIKNDTTAVSFVRFTSIGTLARISNSANPLKIDTYLTGCKGANRDNSILALSGLLSAKRVTCP